MIEQIINDYFENNTRKLHILVDKILYKLGLGFIEPIEREDFYSLANEIFCDVIKRYDKERSFDAFLYSCLLNKFKTEMTRINRLKRQADKNAISIDAPIGDDENCTLNDTIADKNTVESIFFRENKDSYSRQMRKYLSRLSPLQQEVLRLISLKFTQKEILKELNIDKKQYDDCCNAIHSYRNIEVLL